MPEAEVAPRPPKGECRPEVRSRLAGVHTEPETCVERDTIARERGTRRGDEPEKNGGGGELAHHQATRMPAESSAW